MRDKLRAIKVNPEDERVPTMTEIALVPEREIPGIRPYSYQLPDTSSASETN